MSINTKIFRYMCKRSDNNRDKGLVIPKNVIRYDNICYGNDSSTQLCDVYIPRDVKGKLPVIVNVHGGAFVYGSKEVYQFYCMDLANRGFAVVNFTYRLAPENKFPAQLIDTNLIFNWVISNAEKYAFDIDRIYGVGDSAGAQLLALYCCYIANKEFAQSINLKLNSKLKIRALALSCGLYDMRGRNRKSLGVAVDVFEKGGTEAELTLLSPAAHITKDFPPTFILTAVADFQLEENKCFYALLCSKGVKSVMKIYGNEENKLGHIFHCNIKSDDAKIANDDQCDFLRKM